MTIKEALNRAECIINTSNEPDRVEICRKLRLCSDTLHLMKWTKETVMDACEQFIIDNGRGITTKDFELVRMPRHPSIKRLFGMTAADFRDKYFPNPNTELFNHSPYRDVTKQEMIKLFTKEYLRVKPVSGPDFFKRYDNMRCPNFQTVCSKCGIPAQWRLLIETLKLPKFEKVYKRPGSVQFKMSSEAPIYQKWDKVNNAHTTNP